MVRTGIIVSLLVLTGCVNHMHQEPVYKANIHIEHNKWYKRYQEYKKNRPEKY